MSITQTQDDSAARRARAPSGRTAPLEPLLAVTGPFWRGRNLRRLLSVLIPFALACVFTYKMLSGQWFNFHPSTYASFSLVQSFLFPLNIFQIPVQVLVLGVLLGLLTILPILAAQSFGPAPVSFFIACLCWLAHLPIMALFSVLAVCCAAAPPLLKRSGFYSALLGLVPQIAYLFLAVQIVLAWSRQSLLSLPLAPGAESVVGPAHNLLAGLLIQLTSPGAVCVLTPVFMLMLFIAGLPTVLGRSKYYSLLLVVLLITAYLGGSVFILSQPTRYPTAGPVISAAELLWPEMATAAAASRQGLVNLSPIQQTWLYSPALLGACLALLLLAVLILANRWSKWPTAVLALATTLLTLTCLLLFHYLVGPETLNYAVLRARFDPDSALLRYFGDLPEYQRRLEQYRIASDPSLRLEMQARRDQLMALSWQARQPQRLAELEAQIRRLDRTLRYADQTGRSAALRRRMGRVFQRIVRQFEDRVALSKRACRAFLKAYPRSRHRPHLLYMQALATDARLDLQRLEAGAGIIVHYDFPSPESKAGWQELLDQFPDHALACPAGMHLGRLLAREGRFERALEVLDRGRRAGQGFLASQSPAVSQDSFVARLGLPPAQPVSPEDIRALIGRIRAFEELIRTNYRDPLYGTEPLRRFCTKDPHGPDYLEQIGAIVTEFPEALVAQNIRLELILAQPPRRQLPLLQSAIVDFADHPAAKDALFYLARLEMRLAGSDPDKEALRDQATRHFRRFLREYPESYQAKLAEEQLSRLALLAGPGQTSEISR